jgi:uncharacterized metal-binding protein YceD (DUF177 family)
MDKLNEYNIAFKGLKDGIHHYHYKVDQPFFEHIENSFVEKGDFEVDVTLHKKPQMLQLDFSINGEVQTICDNCLGDLTLPVSNKCTLYVKFGIMYDEPSEEIIVLPHEEYEFNIAQLIYEYIVVSLPLRSVHEENKCDPDMIKTIGDYSGEKKEKNKDNDKATDPRWDALKKLKDNSN